MAGWLRLRLIAFELLVALLGACSFNSVAQPTSDPLTEAHQFIASGQLSKSETYLRSYIAEHPSSAEGHFLLGYVLFRSQKAMESLAEYTAGAKIQRPGAEELQIVASDYVLIGDFADADKWFSEVTREKPEDFHIWYLLGRTKYNEGRYDEAVASFEHVLALHPRDIEAENNLGLALRESNKPDQAKEAFRQAIAWQGPSPADAQPLLNLGALLVAQGEVAIALPLLLKAAMLAPNNPTVHEQLGSAYVAQRELPNAQLELERAVALAPDASALHYQLGEVYRKEKKPELAQREFDLCTKLNSTHSSGKTPNPFRSETAEPRELPRK